MSESESEGLTWRERIQSESEGEGDVEQSTARSRLANAETMDRYTFRLPAALDDTLTAGVSGHRRGYQAANSPPR